MFFNIRGVFVLQIPYKICSKSTLITTLYTVLGLIHESTGNYTKELVL